MTTASISRGAAKPQALESHAELGFGYAPVPTLRSPYATPNATSLEADHPKAEKLRVLRSLGKWGWEVLGFAIAVGTMAAITALLVFADGHPPAVYKYGITLNGIIAIISTISKGAMLTTVGVSLGQLKWNRFTNPDRPLPLAQFIAIDKASRGALGSAASLLSTWRMPLVFAGALITILSVGFDFAVQQIVGFDQRSIQTAPGEFARPTLPRAQSFLYDENERSLEGSSEKILQLFKPGSGLLSVLDNGIGNDERTLDVAANCATGNCTFPVFNTLAMCSSCADVTNEVVNEGTWTSPLPRNMTRHYIKYRMPGGLPLHQWVDVTAANKTDNMTFTASWATIHTVAGLGWNITCQSPLQMSVLRFPYQEIGLDAVKQQPTAVQCGLVPCVKTLNITVLNGVQNIHTISSWTNMTQLAECKKGAAGFRLEPPPLIDLPRAAVDAPQLLQDFYMNTSAKNFLSRVLQNYFNGSYTLHDQLLVSGESSNTIPSEKGPYAGRGPFFLNGTDDIPHLMENVANAITTYMRRESAKNETLNVQGTAMQTLTFISIQWAWFAVPGVMLVATALLLITTATITSWKRVPVWKDSALPLLFHGLDHWQLPSKYQGPKESDVAMQDIAKDLHVELRSDVNGRVRLMTRKPMELP